MTEIKSEIVLTRDRSSGRVHKRIRVADRRELFVTEACNLDQAGKYDVIASTVGVDPDALCRRCFGPEIAGDEWGAPI